VEVGAYIFLQGDAPNILPTGFCPPSGVEHLQDSFNVLHFLCAATVLLDYEVGSFSFLFGQKMCRAHAHSPHHTECMASLIDERPLCVNTYCMEKSAGAQLGPKEWIDAAYAAFERGGVSAVKVEPLAKELSVTRGSFYWHFKDRKALLLEVVRRWDAKETEAAISANENGGGDARSRLERLLQTCGKDDGRLEIGMRSWAAGDADAREAIARIDQKRIEYMVDLLEEAGGAQSEAQRRARVGYIAWLGAYTDAAPSSVEQRLDDMNCLSELMLAGIGRT